MNTTTNRRYVSREEMAQEEYRRQAFSWACLVASDWGWTWEWDGDYMDVLTDHGWEGVTSVEFVALVSEENSNRQSAKARIAAEVAL